MRTELPICRRCCICLPLRYGLMVWTYIKLILDLLMVFGILSNLYVVTFERSYMIKPAEIRLLTILLIVLTIDIVLNSIFIVGAHKKNAKLLRVYYIYSVILWAIIATLFIIVSTYIFYVMFTSQYIWFLWTVLAFDEAMAFIQLIAQSYFVLLIRSEMIKLNSVGNFQFVNNEAEAMCSLQIEYSIPEPYNMAVEKDIERYNDIYTTCDNVNGACGVKTCCKIVPNNEKPM